MIIRRLLFFTFFEFEIGESVILRSSLVLEDKYNDDEIGRFADKKLKLLMSSSDLYNSLVPKVILFPKCSKDEIPIFVCEICR